MRILMFLFLFFSHSLSSAVMIKKHQWPQGSKLNVVFLDGSTQLKSLVKDYAVLWVKDSNLSFQFFDSLDVAPTKKHIRVSFTLNNASSLGNQGGHQKSGSTMNLFDLKSSDISDGGAKRLILHEFGHALGLEHEYQNPYWPYGKKLLKPIIVSCIDKIKKSGYNSSDAVKKCERINQKVDLKNALVTAYDEHSIMNYPFQVTLANGETKKIKAMTKLSYLDTYAINKWYPKEQPN